MNICFKDITYLKTGTARQVRCYEALQKAKIFELLTTYRPILVGTIPIGIDIENSDADIVCEVHDFVTFESDIRKYFSSYEDFKIRYKAEVDVLVCNFKVQELEIELYGSKKPSDMTNGYRHMVIEAKILTLANEAFKEEIIQLKSEGVKTEPAFAKLLNLEGDPYMALLALESYEDEQLLALLKNTKF